MNALPSGTVTFLFTDIEDSTRLWQEQPEAMAQAHELHDRILHEAVTANHGYVFQIVGDSFSVAFHNAHDALLATLTAQRELLNQQKNSPLKIKARMGLHSAAAEIRADGKYDGYVTLASTQRVMSVAHGGQTLLSQATFDLLAKLPDGISLTDLGEHQLKSLRAPLHLYQLTAPDLPRKFPPLQTLESHPNNLPLQLTSFIGREKQLDDVTRLITTNRMITLIGPGGTGKTRLSLQLAEAQLLHFKHGVWFIELAALSDATYIVSTIASAFNLREVQGIDLHTILTDYLRGKQLLLVLDNCEHLVETSAKLADQLLHECPALKIIASSREALGVDGETVYRVPSLKDDEASRLFIERATKADSRFQVTESNASYIAQICSRLDGIPLAVELAAARVKLFSPQQIAERLDDRFKLLTGGSRTALPRQQTLRALIDWSYQTLNENEQRTLRRLAVFSGGWTFEAAESVVGESEAMDGLAGLVNKSLVNVEEQEGVSRYSFLETIRQYASEKLSESDEAIQTRDKHFDFFVEFAIQISDRLINERAKKWADLLDLENDNLRSALKWGMERHLLNVVPLLRCLADFWLAHGYLTEGQEWGELILQKLERYPENGAEVDLARAYAHRVVAILSNNQGNHVFAREHIEQAIPLFQRSGETKDLTRSLIILTTSSAYSGDIEKAFEAIHEGIRKSREAGLKFETAWGLEVLSQLTFVARGLSAAQEIDAYMQESIRLLEEIDHPWKTTTTNEYLARRAYAQGDIETARKHANEVLANFQEAGSIFLATNYRSDMAHALRRTGHLDEALHIYRETIVAYQDYGHRGAIAHQLECFAYISIAQEQGERAVKLLSAANALRERVNSRRTPQEQMEYEKSIADLQIGLEEGKFKECWAEGQTMTIEQAVELALRMV